MDQQKLEESNRSKYGNKGSDLIAQTYEMDHHMGDTWCVVNVLRYLQRYIRPGSSKANNLTDLLKAKDYLQRAIENHPDYKAQAPLTEVKEGQKNG